MEILVACVLAYYLVRHGPELIAEAFAEIEFAKRGEMSPRAAARLKRLLDAGIDPAAGGAARQFFGNAWRDAWLDLEDARAAKRAARASGGPDAAPAAGGRFWDWFDEAVERAAARWRARGETRDDPHEGQDDERRAGPVGGFPGPDDPGGAGDYEDPDFPDWPRFDEPDPPAAPPDSEPAADDTEQPPVRVDSEQGEPIREPAPTGRTEPMTAAVVHVTGVISAAQEARAIQRQLEATTAAYAAELAALRRRVHQLATSTIGEIQQAMNSRTVGALGIAAEAIAAAEAHAAAATAEVGPQMGAVARAFDRIAT